MKKFKVFNVEFDGMDKVGKDSIMHQIFKVSPNKYIPKARGLLSQIAYSKMFNRDYEYDVSEGYLENTLIVYLTVDQDDWNVRCALTNEHENNKNRSDVEAAITYNASKESFDYAYEYIKGKYPNAHMMKFNTTDMTPYRIIIEVVKELEKLNE